MTERKSLESVADDLDSFVHDLREEGNSDATATWLERRVTALRSLAAQDQKPKAWLQTRGDVEIVSKTSLDPGGFERGWTEEPLFTAPPPAAVVMPDHGGADAGVRETLLNDEWSNLVEKDDRTSPEEYPEMCLITREEVGEIIDAALSHQPAPVAANASAEARLREADEQSYADLRASGGIFPEVYGAAQLTNDQIKYMVDRFLGWKLPRDTFNPDCGISFNKEPFNTHTPHPSHHEPSGTNLFDATQSMAMVRYMLDGLPHPHASDCDKQGTIPSGYGEYTPVTVGGSTTKSEGGTEGRAQCLTTARQDDSGFRPCRSSVEAGIKPGPSDRTADVDRDKQKEKQ